MLTSPQQFFRALSALRVSQPPGVFVYLLFFLVGASICQSPIRGCVLAHPDWVPWLSAHCRFGPMSRMGGCNDCGLTKIARSAHEIYPPA
jgi:hypothetical protein